MSGGREIFELLSSEDVEGDQMDLGVTVLASLGSRHVDNFAGPVLDHNEAVLAQSRALHGVGQRRASIGGIEGDIVLQRIKKKRSVTSSIANADYDCDSARSRTRPSLRIFALCVLYRGAGTRGVCGVVLPTTRHLSVAADRRRKD